MISVADALKLIRDNTPILPSSELPLQQASGFVLAADIYAGVSIPAFDQSAMDGYAFRFEDLLHKKEFIIAGEVAAGDYNSNSIQPFQAIRIFTGAPVPAGCDTVVMQEKTEVKENRLFITDDLLHAGRNVRTKGAEINAGDLALEKNTLLTPAAIGFLASLGITEVTVIREPSVHIIITGNELQMPGNPLQAGQVYESNSVMLQTALLQLGIRKIAISFAKDNVAKLTATLSNALHDADLVLLTGGVSVGNYDFVVEACEACGVKALFHKVAQRPGKPLFAGTKNEKIIFGLPGNPASVLTCFYVYVTKALENMSGRKNILQTKHLPLSEAFVKNIRLTQFLKARCTGDEVTLLQAQESFRLSSFSIANCLVMLPAEKMEFAKGERVETILLPYL